MVERSPLKPINGGSGKDEDETPKKKMRRLLDSDDEEDETVKANSVSIVALSASC